MQSAFVEIGLDSDAFLYVGDFLENLEDYDHVVTRRRAKYKRWSSRAAPCLRGPRLRSSSAGVRGPEAAPQEKLPHASEPSVPETGGLPDVQPRAPVQSACAGTFAHGRPSWATEATGGGRSTAGPRPTADRVGTDDRGRRGGLAVRRGGRGGRRQQGGRDLPPSKYASPRPFTPRPHEPATEELPPDYEPMICLANRWRSTKTAFLRRTVARREPPAEPANAAAVEQLQGNPPETTSAAASLPSSLFAAPQTRQRRDPDARSRAGTAEWRWSTPIGVALSEPPVVPAAPVEEPESATEVESETDVEGEETNPGRSPGASASRACDCQCAPTSLKMK